MLFDKAIQDGVEIGIGKGFCIGFYNQLQHLTTDAVKVLRRKNHSTTTPREEGARAALQELGLIRRRWWGRYEITDAGRSALMRAGTQ